MIILDENINQHQCLLLRSWRIRPRLIGRDIAHKGIQDEQIVPLLHGLNRATFFTRDFDFYRPELCHSRYCLAFLAVHRFEVAVFVRRLLRHPQFNTRAKRMGKVVRASSAGIQYWERHSREERFLAWES